MFPTCWEHRRWAERELALRKSQALKDSEDRYRRLVEMSPVAILVNRNDRIEFVNPAAILLFGAASGDQIAGKSVYEVFHPHFQPILRERIQRVLAGETVPLIEEGIIGVDGRERKVEVVAGPIVDQFGPGIQVILRDISERKRAEEVIVKAKTDLERQVSERTAQLRSIASELTMAEQRERKRLARVLHDHLQQLLVGAKFRVAALARTGTAAAQEASEDLERLLNEAIEASRSLTAELSPPIRHEAGLVPALQWIAKWMKEKHGLIAEINAGQEIGPIREELFLILFQAVRELLFNTVKHARVDRARIDIRQDADSLEIVVSDDGVGIHPAGLTLEKFSASGFGLFNIRERLNLLGGSMEIESAPEKGSRFILRAPITPPARTSLIIP